ncbi:MAG: (d)CMP kinase [Verrucomicrobiaceae bacterium]|jgi:cytidylate kinase|nr:(d)CMP kinase [Verrucomicrobiaceae bacterium]
MPPVITIDGPAASGKSSIARRVARRLGCTFVGTGNMYRAFTWAVLNRGIDPNDPAAIVAALPSITFECPVSDGETHVRLDGHDLTPDELNSDAVNAAVSLVARVPEVRARLVADQRSLISLGPLVMEGRDIGSVVFPDSPFKIYIDASEEVRAARRRAQGQADNLAERDRIDKQRKSSPLVIPEGATIIDNSAVTLEEAVEQVIAALRAQGLP